MVKNPPGNAKDVRDTGLISGSGRSPGGEHGNPLQYSCLENPMNRGAWLAESDVAEQLSPLLFISENVYVAPDCFKAESDLRDSTL